MKATVWIGDTPPSLNVIAGRGSRFAFTRAKRQWQDDLAVLLMAEGLPRGLSRVEVTAVLAFPTKRRRDEGNFRTLIEKSLGDALVEGGWLTDDTLDHYRFGGLAFEKGQPRTTLTLTCQTAASQQVDGAAR